MVQPASAWTAYLPSGANKSVESARLDITHHRRLTRSDLDQIEALANEVVQNVSRTEKLTLDRKDADANLVLIVPRWCSKGSDIRILRIADHDIQACGGTHHDEPGRIGQIRIVRSNAVQMALKDYTLLQGQAAWSMLETKKQFYEMLLKFSKFLSKNYRQLRTVSLANGRSKESG